MQEVTGPQPASVFSAVIDQASIKPVPEFGSIAISILVVSTIFIIIVSARTRLEFI